ncbi:adenylate kinase [Nematocida parisii]|uniref:uncharacterized protein n=1 Tax=Nematocida parisii (strain ERTm1 / ATCC PRA-289) TaxID=881290 RepID=UPI000264B45E|nr:uncharacterized protein NEPG_00851 [Nematocida parisii ERTm1]KAI5128642.1 adenylate kinase [Nematocida parisii]EIJ94184.1 hypothetical protein NEPG_00851 [Nematocida parisii ERTm1]KAI5128934.1 adenylate kinase [Nematocida parisii]KAI5141512.1 adenylate kinase [Nematocida parisii]KAI5144846.1 adenylate kinase [Nematocida parisii]|eukprot:XP_013058680.1 hypothetical protein NEPG_00851 [Nematocida parisii ERTm1]
MGYKILVTGTPGVGKTTLTKYMKTRLNYRLIEMSDLIAKKKLFTNKCKIYDTLEYNPEDVERYLEKKIKDRDSYIIDTHDPEIVHFIKFDIIIVLSAELSVLYDRYQKRGYNKIKTDENLQVEIMEVIYNEVIEVLCEDEEEAERIIKVETVQNKQPKKVEDIYKEITENKNWKRVIDRSKNTNEVKQ